MRQFVGLPFVARADIPPCMDWKTLLTGFVGALGGTATALALVGIFGKTLLEHWFKKDFKRFEATLNASTAREQTKFELAHPDRVSAVKEVYRLCKDLQLGISELCILRSLTANGRNQSFIENLEKSKVSILGKLAAPNKYIVEHEYYFEEAYIANVTDFMSYVATLIANENQTDMRDFAAANQVMNDKLKIVGSAIKELIGS
jgi:hypothetical protein